MKDSLLFYPGHSLEQRKLHIHDTQFTVLLRAQLRVEETIYSWKIVQFFTLGIAKSRGNYIHMEHISMFYSGYSLEQRKLHTHGTYFNVLLRVQFRVEETTYTWNIFQCFTQGIAQSRGNYIPMEHISMFYSGYSLEQRKLYIHETQFSVLLLVQLRVEETNILMEPTSVFYSGYSLKNRILHIHVIQFSVLLRVQLKQRKLHIHETQFSVLLWVQLRVEELHNRNFIQNERTVYFLEKQGLLDAKTLLLRFSKILKKEYQISFSHR